MAGIPTYQEINRQRAEANAMQQAQMQQQGTQQQVAAEAEANKNPVLTEYMDRSIQPQQAQGLVPRDPMAEYASMAEQVARSVQNADEYGQIMVNAGMQGQVPMEAVLQDERIPVPYRESILAQLQQPNQRGLA